MKNLKTFEGFEYSPDQDFSESLQYHLENDLGLLESIYRIGSESWLGLVNETRTLHEQGLLNLSEEDAFIVSTDAGKTGIYEGKEVYLDVPFFEGDEFDGNSWFDLEEDVLYDVAWKYLLEAEYRGRKVKLGKPFRTPSGPKKFAVYVKNDKGNVVKVTFGLKGARVKNYDKARAKSFQARHRCSDPGPRWKPRWWSCNVGKFSKALSLSSSHSW
jgi:hypothetical protein